MVMCASNCSGLIWPSADRRYCGVYDFLFAPMKVILSRRPKPAVRMSTERGQPQHGMAYSRGITEQCFTHGAHFMGVTGFDDQVSDTGEACRGSQEISLTILGNQ